MRKLENVVIYTSSCEKKRAIENISSVKKLMKIEYDAQPITMRKKERKKGLNCDSISRRYPKTKSFH